MPLNPADYKTYSEFQDAIIQAPGFQALPKDDPRRTQVLGIARDKYYKAHGVHEDIGPTDIVPPNPTIKDGAATTGEFGKIKGPLTPAPTTVLSPTPTPEGEPRKVTPEVVDNRPDLAGRVKAGAESGLSWLDKQVPGMEGINDPIRMLVHALPGDNIQAGIDAAMALSMLTGVGEVEGTGGVAYKVLRELPEALRGTGRLAARMVAPTIGGAAGGATEGKATEGAMWGAGEQLGGEVLSGIGRGMFGLANKAIQATDLKRVGTWLADRLANFPGMKDIGDFRKLFIRGEFEDAATDKLGKVEKNIAGRLDSLGKGTSTSKATVFAPEAQDVAQGEALSAETGAKPKTVFGPEAPKEAPVTEAPKKPTVFAQKPQAPEQLYAKVKRLQDELKAAKTGQKGSRVMDEIRANLAQAQADARAATAAAKAARKPVDIDAAVKESQRLGAERGISGKPEAYQSPRMVAAASPELEIELPGPVVDYLNESKKLGLPRRSKYPFNFETINEYIRDVEDKGWALVNATDPAQAAAGKAMRSSVFQAENNVADALRQKLGDKAADEWLASRQQYRAARVLTQLFRSPSLVDQSGKVINWNELQRLVDAAGREGFYDDLKLAFGKEGADGFIDQLTRNAPNERDIPGRGVLTTHSRIYGHPGAGKANLRIPFQIPIPTIRAGDVPFNLGRNRALSALLVLGPERFAQMMFDMVKMQQGDLGAMKVEPAPAAAAQ